MAYLEPYFEPDVFVSYSHADPRGSGASPLKAWTQALIQKLQNEIIALEDTEFDRLRLWIDRDIDPTAHLTDQLRELVSGSGVLIIVMSKRYLGSSWCRDELEWFRKQIQDRAGDPGRVFIIRAQPTDIPSWPDFLRGDGNGLPGFSFYDPETGFPWGWPDLHEKNLDFAKAMCGLETILIKRLRELRGRGEKHVQAQVAPPKPAPSGARRIYLHAPADCEPARADIGSALKQDGIIAVTAHAAGGGLADWQREAGARIETAKRCEALALLRPYDSDRFLGDLFDIGVDERARIADARGAPLPCAVLDKTGASLPIDLAPFGIERFDVNRENWRGEFRQWLDAARAEAAAHA